MSPRAGTRSKNPPESSRAGPQSQLQAPAVTTEGPAVTTEGPAVTTGGPRSHNRKALGRSSAQYSFYVPRRTSQPGEALSRAAPPKVHILSAAERSRRGVQRARNPSHAHRRRFHDAGPRLDGTATEHRKAYRPSPAAHHPTTAYATERFRWLARRSEHEQRGWRPPLETRRAVQGLRPRPRREADARASPRCCHGLALPPRPPT
jgi:hypothetical protein